MPRRYALAFRFYRFKPLPALLGLLLAWLAALPALAQPTISSFSPGSGAAGSSVVITGSGFTGTTSVRFGELSAPFTVNSSTQITAVVPRAASTQLINVTTSAGYVFSASDFTVTRGSSLTYAQVATNFAGVSGGTNAAPAVADLDGDGRLDLLVGLGDGTITRYEQNTVNGTAFTSLGSLRDGSNVVIDMGSQATVAVVDLEGDGLYNLLLGRGDGTVSEYEQTAAGAGTFALVQDNFAGISTLTNTAPAMTDLDGDGKLEMLVGKGDGITSHSEQNTVNTDSFYRIDTNFNALQLSGNAAPFCVDLDGNGRLDMLMGLSTGALYRYEQSATGSFTMSQQSSSFNSITAGTNAKPCVTDIDGDGLLDLLVGRGDGTITRYEQSGTVPAPTITGFTPTSGPVGTTVTVTGTNLGAVSAVTVNGTAGTITGLPTATSFTFTVGSGSSTGVIGVTTPGGTVSSSGSFTVGTNTAPTALSLSPTAINENVAAGSTVGAFLTTDAQGGAFTYTLVTGSGSTDNASFGISGSSLTISTSPDYETKGSYAIRVRTTDSGGLFFEQTFTITINNQQEQPTISGFTPSGGTVGTSVTVTGTNYNVAGAVTVRFAGTVATAVTVNSNTQLTALVPAGAGTGTISVQNADGTATSSGTFTVWVAATVTTTTPASVTAGSAVLGGSVTSNNSVTERGVVYLAGNGTPTVSNTKVPNGSGTGSFSATVPGLAGNTLYSVRAYAINGAGTSYGATQTFTTLNNPPVANDDSYTVNEDSGPIPLSVLSNDTDPDAGTTLSITAVTQPANGTVTFTSTNVTFTPAAGFNGSTSFTYTIADGDGGSDTGTVTVTVTPVNDAPVLTTSGGNTIFLAGGGAVVVDAGLTATDPDNPTLASGTVSIGSGFTSSQDVLSFINSSSATYGNITGSYTSGTGILSLTSAGATATVAQWQAVLRAVRYNNASATPTGTSRTISFRVSDGALNSTIVTKTITLPPPPAVTGVSVSAELPGQAVTLTGMNFTSGSTVTFGGVAAGSVTFNNATSLTATVPAGAAAGTSPIVVTTANGSSASSPGFEVLTVYRNTTATASSCLSTTAATINGSGGAGTWVYLRLPAGQGGGVVAAIENTLNLGTVTAGVLAQGTATAQPVRDDGKGRRYLDRNFYLTATNQIFTGQSVRVRFFGLSSELARLAAVDANATAANLKVSQYDGPNEDCSLTNNGVPTDRRLLSAPATVVSGADWFTAEVTVADHFSEFYLTGASTPLPVQLSSFVAQPAGPAAVQLAWTTAQELNSATFAVERSPDGRVFTAIGTVAAAGRSTSRRTYQLTDVAAPSGTSYYRLRQVDTDGSFAYSEVRVVQLTGAGLTLYPNPAAGRAATLTGAAPGQPVHVLDALGRPVLTTGADATGAALLRLPAGWPAGVYLVRAGQQALRLLVE